MRRPFLLVLLGAVVVAVAWFLLVFRPLGDDLDEAEERRDAAERQEQVLEAQLRQLQGLEDERPALEAEQQRLAAAIPPTADLAGFILSANQIAASSGVDWLSVSPSPPAAPESAAAPTPIALTIQVQGGFFQVLDYLNRLEDLPRTVVVDSISVSAGAADTAGGTTSATTGGTTLAVTLSGRMFTTEAPAAAPAPGGGTTTTTTAPGSTTTTTAASGATTTTSGSGSQISARVG